jgi:hypothetical protein
MLQQAFRLRLTGSWGQLGLAAFCPRGFDTLKKSPLPPTYIYSVQILKRSYNIARLY